MQSNPLPTIIRTFLPAISGLRILDIGCGSGALAATLQAGGADVTGLDPNPAAIEAARSQAPAATFYLAAAEALPFQDEAFDAAIIVNALHHVPAEDMDRALAEARRVIRTAGVIVVIEPLAEGSSFEAMRLIDDETEIRRLAQQALARAAASQLFKSVATGLHTWRREFPDAAAVLKGAVTVDPARQAAIDGNREAVIAAILKAASRTTEGHLSLEVPLKVDVLRKVA